MHTKSVSDEKQVAQLHLLAGLHALDRRPVEAARVGEALLRHVEPQSPHTDAVADSSAGFYHPRGLFGWHPVNATGTMIISQQQFCGIL